MTYRLKILPERQKRTQQGILLEDVDFDEFDLSKYNKKMNINVNDASPEARVLRDNPEKGTQIDFNLVSSSSSSVGESVRTPKEAVKQQQEEVSEASSIKSSDKSVEREEAQNQKSLMRRLYDSMFEEVEVDIPQSRQVSVATEDSQASSSSLPMNVKKSYEPSSSSSSRRSSGRSALLPVEEGALSEYV